MDLIFEFVWIVMTHDDCLVSTCYVIMVNIKLINIAETLDVCVMCAWWFKLPCLGKYVSAIHQRLVFGMNIIPTFNQYPHCRMNIKSVIILVGLSVRWPDLIINITLISSNLTQLTTSPHLPPSRLSNAGLSSLWGKTEDSRPPMQCPPSVFA